MAEGRPDPQTEGNSGAIGTTASAAPVPLAPALVLGPDGKPCRSCTSKSAFSAWAAQARTLKAPTALANPSASSPAAAHDCPADVETLGRHSWTLLHSIAATYPTSPTVAQQDDVVGFVKLFSRLYPCWVCGNDFQAYIRKDPVKAASRGEFGTWLCNAHNDVNKKIGNPVFDCSKWEERWRTGWKNGTCD